MPRRSGSKWSNAVRTSACRCRRDAGWPGKRGAHCALAVPFRRSHNAPRPWPFAGGGSWSVSRPPGRRPSSCDQCGSTAATAPRRGRPQACRLTAVDGGNIWTHTIPYYHFATHYTHTSHAHKPHPLITPPSTAVNRRKEGAGGGCPSEAAAVRPPRGRLLPRRRAAAALRKRPPPPVRPRRRPPPPQAAAAGCKQRPPPRPPPRRRLPHGGRGGCRLGGAAAAAAAACTKRRPRRRPRGGGRRLGLRRRPCSGRAAAACGRQPPPNSETGMSDSPWTVPTWADRPQTWRAHRCLHMGPAPGESTGLPASQTHALVNLPQL